MDLVEDVDVVSIPSGDANKRRDRAMQIEQRVHFDGGLGGTKMRRRKQAEAEVDGGRVQCVCGGIEIDVEAFAGIELMCLLHQPHGQFGAEASVVRLVGVGQRGVAHRRGKTHGVELVGLGVEARLDVAQALAVGQLRKRHGAILLGAGQSAHANITTVAGHATCERSPGNEIHQLRKSQLARVHQ